MEAVRIALFGGSFDPPHVAHQMAARWVVSTQKVDRVLWVPCYRHAFGKISVSFEDRFEMTRLAAAALGEAAEVSRIEADLGGDSRTLVTLEQLQKERAPATWSILIGADLAHESRHWSGYETLARLASFLVVGRSGYDSPSGGPVLPNIASSDIRARLACGEDVSALVPADVLAYIHRRGLYGTGSS